MSNPVPDSPKWQPGDPQAQSNPLDYYQPSKVIPSPPDDRDFQATEHSPFVALAAPRAVLPRKYLMPDPWGLIDQKTRGSCSAFGACGLARTSFARVGVNFDPSEEAQYALVREVEGTLGQDDGAAPRDNMDVMAKTGIADEADAVYLSKPLTWTPDAGLRAKMANRRITKYFVSPDDATIKQTVYGTGTDDGLDVSACFVLYKNFGPDPSFNIPMPAMGQWGGHNMRVRGWDDDRAMPGTTRRGAWYIKNQWNGWGDQNGCAWISYAHAHLAPGSGGLWYSDTWAAVVDAPPAPPAPTPTPGTYTVRINQWVATTDGSNWAITRLAEVPFTPDGPGYIGVALLGPDGTEQATPADSFLHYGGTA